MAPREIENNTYAKFWGDKQRTISYVMVFLEWSIVIQTLELWRKFWGDKQRTISYVMVFLEWSIVIQTLELWRLPCKSEPQEALSI